MATQQGSHRPLSNVDPACGHKEIPRSTVHIVVITRYQTNRDPNGDKQSCDSASNDTDQYQNGSSNLLTSYREQSRSTRVVFAYPRPTISATKRTNNAPFSFDQQVQVSRGHPSYKNKENCNTEVYGGGGLELVKPARASIQPTKVLGILEKSP